MPNLERQLAEDRALRDAARALVEADFERVKEDLTGKSLGKRAVDRLQDGAAEIFEQASEAADNNRGVLAVLVGAIILWFARNPILSLFFDEEEIENSSTTSGDDPPHPVAAPEGETQ